MALRCSSPEANITQHARELAAQARSADAQVGFGFRQVQRLHAVVEQRAAGLLAVEPAHVHLGQVREPASAQRALLAEQLPQRAEQLFVAERCHVAT